MVEFKFTHEQRAALRIVLRLAANAAIGEDGDWEAIGIVSDLLGQVRCPRCQQTSPSGVYYGEAGLCGFCQDAEEGSVLSTHAPETCPHGQPKSLCCACGGF